MATVLTTIEQLDLMTNWLIAGTPFLHVRFNDGEFNHAFQLVPKGARLGNNHETSTPELCQATMEAFTYATRESVKEEKKVIVGSYASDTSFTFGQDEKQVARDWLQKQELLDKMRWGQPDLWYSTDTEREMIASGKNPTESTAYLVRLLRTIKEKNNAVLVGCPMIEEAKFCLSAHFIKVGKTDSWLHTNKVMETCQTLSRVDPAFEKTTFIWCAGVAGKPWAVRLWNQFPQSSHIDAGHLFDLAFGWPSRMWMRRDGPHKRMYQSEIIPYIQRSTHAL